MMVNQTRSCCVFHQADGIAMLRIILSALDPIAPEIETRDKETKVKAAADKAAADKAAGKRKPRRPGCCAALLLGLQAFNKAQFRNAILQHNMLDSIDEFELFFDAAIVPRS